LYLSTSSFSSSCHDSSSTEIYTLSLHDALPISARFEFHVDIECFGQLFHLADNLVFVLAWHKADIVGHLADFRHYIITVACIDRSEEHTSELQSRENLVCRLLLEKKQKIVGY